MKIVSGNCKLHEFSSLYVGLWCERLRVWSSARGPFFKGSGNLQWQAVKAVLFSLRWGFLPKWNYLPKKQNESVRVPEFSSLTFIFYFKIWLTDCWDTRTFDKLSNCQLPFFRGLMSCGQVGNQIIGRVLIWCCCGNGCLKVGCDSIAVCKSDLIRIGTQIALSRG